MGTMAITAGHAQPNARGNIMHLYLANTLNRLRTDEQTFFRMAHVWSFGTDPDLSNDVAQYKLNAIIPKYVQEYLKHVQEETT